MDKGFLSLTFLVCLTLTLCISQSSSQLFNDICNPHTYCNVSAGLICDGGRCGCSSGPFNSNYSYTLRWDPQRSLCVGTSGSVCVGTRTTPIPTGMKRVECVDPLSCLQMPQMVLGVGICQNVPKVFYLGTDCNQTQYCDPTKGLVCTRGKCSCPTERTNTSPRYSLVWDEQKNMCASAMGGACIGTKEGPVPNGQRAVDCITNAECIQQTGATPGVGICREPGSTDSSSPPNSVVSYGILMMSSCIILSLSA
jgi:hypothetical protein